MTGGISHPLHSPVVIHRLTGEARGAWPMVEKCTVTNRDGSPCSAAPRPGRDRCLWHDDALAAERAGWRRKGGEGKSNRARATKELPVNVLTPLQLQGVLSATIAKVLGGQIECGVANSVAGLARALVAVREATEVEARLAELEERAGVADRRIA